MNELPQHKLTTFLVSVTLILIWVLLMKVIGIEKNNPIYIVPLIGLPAFYRALQISYFNAIITVIVGIATFCLLQFIFG